jgi:hypothetical protein
MGGGVGILFALAFRDVSFHLFAAPKVERF